MVTEKMMTEATLNLELACLNYEKEREGNNYPDVKFLFSIAIAEEIRNSYAGNYFLGIRCDFIV